MSTEALMFSRLGRYALRTVAIITNFKTKITGKELAERTGIPTSYQSKVLRRLVEAEILIAQKGHHGGFTLAQEPTAIRLADVLRAVDAMPKEGKCVFEWGLCSSLEPCPLHTKWSSLSTQVMNWAEDSTLNDLCFQS